MSKNDEKILSGKASALVAAMESMPGCFLRPHMLHSGAAGFRLLDPAFNALGTYPYAVIELLVECGYLQPEKQGKFFIYTRTKKRLYAREQVAKEKAAMDTKSE